LLLLLLLVDVDNDEGKISHPIVLVASSELLLLTVADALMNRPNVSGVGFEIIIHAGRREESNFAALSLSDEEE